MRLNIRHDTHYRYERPVRFSAQYLRLTPYSNPSQRVIRWNIATPGKHDPWTDAYGNQCSTLVCDQLTDEIVISASGIIDTVDTKGILPPDETGMPIEVFLRSTPQTEIDDRIRDFAAPFKLRAQTDRVAVLHELMLQLAERIEYREGETHVQSTGAEALAEGVGVCQDQAHAFIACARAIGIPARYVSGYLYTGENENASVASHAWASAWVDHLGWVSFDVANRVCGTERHVGLATALDYNGAAPVRGVRHGGSSAELMEVQVRVTQA
jgi:transglutaminase-like putative cysteine protease